jgi:hypothetical protein
MMIALLKVFQFSVIVCDDKWHGENCSLQCNDKCVSHLCHHINGECTEGCIPGWTGINCLQGTFYITPFLENKYSSCEMQADEGNLYSFSDDSTFVLITLSSHFFLYQYVWRDFMVGTAPLHVLPVWTINVTQLMESAPKAVRMDTQVDTVMNVCHS